MTVGVHVNNMHVDCIWNAWLLHTGVAKSCDWLFREKDVFIYVF